MIGLITSLIANAISRGRLGVLGDALAWCLVLAFTVAVGLVISAMFFGVLYESKKALHTSLDLPIPLSSIARITLSPWLSPALSEHVKRTLHPIRGCKNLSIARSTLISNQEWKNLGEMAK